MSRDPDNKILSLRWLLQTTVAVEMLASERYKYAAGRPERQWDRYLVPQNILKTKMKK